MQPWWMSIAASLSGVVVGFVLAQTKEWWSRRRRRKAHWAALSAELELCRRRAETYEADSVLAPLYRLSTTAYRHSLPALLAEGALTEEEVRWVIEFSAESETLNRGMDLAQDARVRQDDKALADEVRRNIVKARRLRPPAAGESGENYYVHARAVIDKHV